MASLLFAGDSVCWISWRHADEADATLLRHTNDVIASFVTAGENEILHVSRQSADKCALRRHRQRFIYIQPRDGTAMVNSGDCLGDLKSELKPCEYISEFVSGGPKNYAYKTHNTVTDAETTVCKVGGITLNYSASQLVNF